MFKNPFSFEGRIRRTEYGLSMLIYYFICFIINQIVKSNQESSVALIFIPLFIPLFWFVLAQRAKRCHDRGNSGWFQLIPFYGFWMLFAEGEIIPNKYGSNPKIMSE